MPKQPTSLNDNHLRLLAAVTNADLDWREAKKNAHERARQRANQEIADKLAERDRVVLSAVNGGLPLVELRRKHQGLHTSHQSTVLEALARTEGLGLAA